MSISELDILREAVDNKAQRWGFAVPYDANVGAISLLNVQVPIWAARRWNVNLNAFQYQGGTITANIIPPENQTSVLVRARIQYGVDAAQEDVLIDYPSRGCVIPVNAAIARVYIVAPTEVLSTGITPPPLLSGFITPCDTGVAATDLYGPTFTTRIASIGAGGQVIVPVPRRARAYRVCYSSSAIIAQPLNVVQVAGQAGGADISWDVGQGSTPAQGEPLEVNGVLSGYRSLPAFQLLPMCGAIRVRNESISATATTVTLQFLLDIS